VRVLCVVSGVVIHEQCSTQNGYFLLHTSVVLEFMITPVGILLPFTLLSPFILSLDLFYLLTAGVEGYCCI
jgi:hypothetical protein